MFSSKIFIDSAKKNYQYKAFFLQTVMLVKCLMHFRHLPSRCIALIPNGPAIFLILVVSINGANPVFAEK
jgi:hypothetical protein